MVNTKKPLYRSILVGCITFIALLCFLLSIITYHSYKRSLYNAYQARMTDILTYIDSHIDHDDLRYCIDNLVETDSFLATRDLIDEVYQEFDVHYLYINVPLNADATGNTMSVIDGCTVEERLYDLDDVYFGYIMDDEYESKYAAKYLDALNGDEIAFFEDFSEWGYDYTGVLPLIDSSGRHFAVLCVDIEISEIRNFIKKYTAINIILIVALGFLFILAFLMWLNRNVTKPIAALEKSVVSFARKSHDQRDPSQLNYSAPDIHTDNEVESLSDAVTQMSHDMKEYVINILDAEGKVEEMKTKVSHMDTLAYQDALTHVKNKAWYDKTKARVDDEIKNGRAEFGIVMADLNHLKLINDTYGHEHGNDYIFGACHQICVIYDHSPVFRIGGDEFVVLLENRDYENRDKLFMELEMSFKLTSSDMEKEPWERYSAAIGMSVYQPQDTSMDDVFKRADELMYKHKLKNKANRK